jgi:hypothetical protein
MRLLFVRMYVGRRPATVGPAWRRRRVTDTANNACVCVFGCHGQRDRDRRNDRTGRVQTSEQELLSDVGKLSSAVLVLNDKYTFC